MATLESEHQYWSYTVYIRCIRKRLGLDQGVGESYSRRTGQDKQGQSMGSHSVLLSPDLTWAEVRLTPFLS